MTKSQASTTTGGMSRAAKKRAKKKQKHYKQLVVETASNDGAKNVEECAKKRPLVEQEGAPKPEQPRKKFKNDSPKEQDPVHVMIQEVLSKLTPLQILQLTKLDDNNQEATIMGEQVNVSDLLQETTTQQRARALFQSLLGNTVSLKEFYDDYWEKQPLYISAADDAKSRFDGILTKAEMKQQLETHPAYYGKDLNVTRYEEGADGVKRRITLDPQPDQDEDFCLVDVKDAWENYQSGCSLRLLCPHKHNDALHALLSMLEFEWSCMVGANVYLTPPGSQGFAPHYDDIEAFCIQLEGYKHWKVYPPLNKRETLPRESSSDFTEDDLKGIEPVLDVVLGPGDILYMPRGWIHQAVTTNRQGHSLHLTISAMQQWAWVDFLELLMPEALEAAAESDISTSLREGLPLRFLDYMGAVHDDTSDDLPEGLKNNAQNGDTKSHGKDDNEAESGDDDEAVEASKIKALRESFREEAKKRIMRVSKEALNMLDAACDQIGKRFISDRLPPALTAAESESTSESNTGFKIWPNTLVRLVRPGVARLALEDGKAILYHCVDNSRVYQGNPLSPMEFELDDAPALEALLTTTEPHWIQVQNLIHDDVQDKLDIAQSLYDEGILAVLAPDKSVQAG